MESPEVVEAGLDGLDKNKAVVVPGLVNKVRASEHALRSALGRSQNRRSDQILIEEIEPARACRRYADGMRARARSNNA